MCCAQLHFALKSRFPTTFCLVSGILNVLTVKPRSTRSSLSICPSDPSPKCPKPEEDARAKMIWSHMLKVLPSPLFCTFQWTQSYYVTLHDWLETRLYLKKMRLASRADLQLIPPSPFLGDPGNVSGERIMEATEGDGFKIPQVWAWPSPS